MNANANNFDPTGGQGYYDPNAAQYQEGMYDGGGGYYDPGVVPPAGFQQGYSAEEQFYQQQQQQQQYGAGDYGAGAEYQDPSAAYGQWNAGAAEVAETAEPGFYFPLPHMATQLYNAPVSAIAYDAGYAAMYVASHTQPFGERPRRASMLVTHSTFDGSLYSSCGGHPEADMGVLQSVYKTFYAGDAPPGRRHHHAIPAHAFQPSYGEAVQQAQMGITALIPTTAGYVTSISPAGVRVHTKGGLCVSDNETSGAVCGAPHPESASTHVSVGGFRSQVHCMDIYQELRIVSSHSFADELGVMAMDKSDSKKALVAGCSDGTLRLVDSRMRGAEVGKFKSHAGGVTAVTTSGDGTLIATTGFAAKPSYSQTTRPYAYPDPNVLIYDVRYLGRGGIVHPFSGMKGGPRFVSFIPDMEDLPNNRFLVASGQRGGGMQILVPFEDSTTNSTASNFIFPQLEETESISCMTLSDEKVAIGTSMSNVLQFELAEYNERKSTLKAGAAVFSPGRGLGGKALDSGGGNAAQEEKMALEVPSFYPPPPALSIDPSILMSKQSVTNVFASYIMCGNPAVSQVGDRENSSFGPIAKNPVLPTPRRTVANMLLSAGSRSDGDNGIIIPTASIDVSLLPKPSAAGSQRKGRKAQTMLANPNKMLFSDSLAATCYKPDSRKKGKKAPNQARGGSIDMVDEEGQTIVPDRYRLTLRPHNTPLPHFDHSKHNKTGLWPGWDYPPSMPSAHAPSLLVLLYFVPEVRCAMLERQYDKRLFASKTVDQVPTLSTELGFLFHNMESISNNALGSPGEGALPRVGVFTPTNLLTCFAAMQEAVNLALLDDNPAVAVKARRPEAFYRFLLHHLDKECGSKKNSKKLLDSLHGFNVVTSSDYVNGKGKSTISSTKSLMLDLSYDPFVNPKKKEKFRFGEVLQHSLCRETKLRAYRNASQSYETVIQRKIVTSLPDVLSLSCACAGRKAQEGLSVWRTSFSSSSLWLPELIEIELEDDGNVSVREQIDTHGQPKWAKFDAKTSIPSTISDLLTKDRGSKKQKLRYRLDATLSFIRDETFSTNEAGQAEGHHVLHVRVPADYRKRTLTKQREYAEQLNKLIQKSGSKSGYKMTLTSKITPACIKSRINRVKECLKTNKNQDDWVLFNGFVVSPTSVEDARAYHVDFKEPCIVMYRAIGENFKSSSKNADQQTKDGLTASNVIQSKSISTGKPSKYAVKNNSDLPGEGDIVALDAEFVSVQEEESLLGDSGNKIVVRETRHALARVSVIDCRTRKIIIDDHVVPKEPVVDYLTRFSGIIPGDLDPKTSPHHLVTPRTAHLKLRFLMERGCIFLGHGLSQDFLTANLFVAPCQVIDTVEIFHRERMRYISLRFLTNFCLKRDMQQDVHDSVEDAMAALELYQKADEMIQAGTFDAFLNKLYEFGQRTDWRLGIDG